MQLLHVSIHTPLIGFVFFATLASYNFHYILAGAITKKKLSVELLQNRPSATIILLLGIAGAVVLWEQSGISTMNTAVAVLLTLLYSVPLLPFSPVVIARSAGFLKTLLLAFTWMFVTAYLPLAHYHLQFSETGFLIQLKRFLFMLMLCIIFDNRDIKVDTVNGLHSLATDLSPSTMKVLIFIVFILLFVLNFFLGKSGVRSSQITALQLSALATLVVYFFSRKRQGYFFYYFLVDGMMILMTLLTTMASI